MSSGADVVPACSPWLQGCPCSATSPRRHLTLFESGNFNLSGEWKELHTHTFFFFETHRIIQKQEVADLFKARVLSQTVSPGGLGQTLPRVTQALCTLRSPPVPSSRCSRPACWISLAMAG